MSVFEFLSFGMLLGLAAGMSPGPLFAIVIAETLRSGLRSGVRLSFVPLCTDLPIILVVTLLFGSIPNVQIVLGWLSLCGALVLLWIAFQTAMSAPRVAATAKSTSFRDAVIINFLNPHPYLFFLTVGGATILRARMESSAAVIAFISGFLGALVAAKLAIALLAHASRRFIAGNAYRWVLRVLGCVLAGFAIKLAYDGVQFLLAP